VRGRVRRYARRHRECDGGRVMPRRGDE
jgi:hypothetical protein